MVKWRNARLLVLYLLALGMLLLFMAAFQFRFGIPGFNRLFRPSTPDPTTVAMPEVVARVAARPAVNPILHIPADAPSPFTPVPEEEIQPPSDLWPSLVPQENPYPVPSTPPSWSFTPNCQTSC
jgi:hypothetical protein